MKKVLILCDAFPPAFNPRMGYLCKYLENYGWSPVIIAEYSPQNMYENLAGKHDVTYINYYFSKNKTWTKLKYAFIFLAELFFDYKSFVVKKEAIKKIKQHDISLILSSSSSRPYSALAASKINHIYGIPFIMDLRDIIEQFPNNEHISKKISHKKLNDFLSKIITRKYLRQRNKILKKAAIITTVSDWHAKTLSKYNDNVKLIYNGFDPELFYQQTITNKQFVISYAGRVESREIKDPSIFFEAVAHLSAEKKIDSTIFRIRFYLTDHSSKGIIRSLAKKYKITDFINIFDTVQSTEIPQILNESSVLLLLANKSTGENSPKGIMGTKLFEYLAVEKPILCVRNDEACLEETIYNAQAGISASTVKETEKFLLEKYAEWQQNGYTSQAVDREYIQQFSRKCQAEQFVALFNELCS
jgi:glycosyltransferase involved in cell wall biosynthesis